MRKVILILRNTSEQEAKRIHTQSLDTEILAGSSFVKNFRDKAKSIELTPEVKRKINYLTLERLLAFGDHVIDGATVSEHLSFANYASIWYYQKFRLYFLIRNKQYDIEIIKLLDDKYDQVEVYTNYDINDFFTKKIKIVLPAAVERKDSLLLIKFFIYFFMRVIAGFFNRCNKKHHHLILDKSLLQPIIMPDHKIKRGNYNLEYLFGKLDKEFCLMNEVEIPKFVKGTQIEVDLNIFVRRAKKSGLFFGESVLLSGFLSGNIRKQAAEANEHLVKAYNIIAQSADNTFDQDICKELRKLHRTSIFYIYKYFSWKRFFSKKNFKTVSGIDENSPSSKTILDAAKANNIITVGIQHGSIHDLHPAYLYTPHDRAVGAYTDYTLVWGNKWKTLLSEKANYNPEGLVITGQIRTDIIPILLKTKKLDTSTSIINVVFASQPQRDVTLRYQAATDIFGAMKILGSDYFLNIKLHPAEVNDRSLYENIAREASCSNYKILEDEDLYQVIANCDILITCFSTVGAETIYFGKPLIILDHLKQDIQQYHSEGVAMQATNQNELIGFLRGFANNKIQVNRKTYEQFVANYSYLIDGNAANRIMTFIRSLA